MYLFIYFKLDFYNLTDHLNELCLEHVFPFLILLLSFQLIYVI